MRYHVGMPYCELELQQRLMHPACVPPVDFTITINNYLLCRYDDKASGSA